MLNVLKNTFGYSSFRQGQREIIENILSGRDVVGIMPTGAGKSLCYQIPAIMTEGLTVVISPLISLMKDQVAALSQNGVRAATLNSKTLWANVLATLDAARRGAISLLYIAPERLDNEHFQRVLVELDVKLVVVDEAHCISQWGHDFRPAYLNIAPQIERLAKRPIVAAFTATATREVRDDIGRQLRLEAPYTISTGYNRANLFFQVAQPDDKDEFLLDYVKAMPEMPGIVYCSTRRAVEEVCALLRENGVQAVRYHAGLSDAERDENQDAFTYDRASVMVATNAFGMGIDKSNVRFVVHYNMPSSLENYYQEAGRAGRDGCSADCILLYAPRDINTARFLISKGDDEEAKKTHLRKLNTMIDYCRSTKCLRHLILSYFGETPERKKCGMCGGCTKASERKDISTEAKMILSCVFRMAKHTDGRRFDADTLTKALRGEREDGVLALGFDQISTWGLLKDHSGESVREMISYLTALGYLREQEGEPPTLAFTQKTFPFLKSDRRVMMRVSKPSGATAIGRGARDFADPELFKKLRTLRAKLALKEGVAPFIVFPDSTLKAMCEERPVTEAELLGIPGVGQVKCLKYGSAFLEAIRSEASGG